MMGRFSGEREKHPGGYNRRVEDRGNGGNSQSHHLGQAERPPSRHLWVGNLPSRVTQGMLLDQFHQFGHIDTIAFVPGRSYAFVNFRRVEEAVSALRTLQGQMFAGLPLKIEFQKGDKPSSNPSFDGGYRRIERNSAERGEPFPLRGPPPPPPPSSSPGRPFLDSSHWISSEEPGDFLIVAFPPHFNFNQNDLERAFSPFGELENVTCFPARCYAIVRYRSIVGACRAKDAMQGRLFNNPRIIISFAKIDSGFKEFDKFPIPPPRFFPETENFPGPRGFDHPRFPNMPPEDRVDHRFSPSSAKRIKTDSFTADDLPDYPLFEKERAPKVPERDLYSRNLVSEFGAKSGPELVENVDAWRKPDGFPGSFPSTDSRPNPVNQLIPAKEWKWEGTIAKGGTPICRARCFPVGKALDFMLPEFLDCTARTGLDMLSRHFYQAADSWVVFFVPDTDSDIAFYNEFLNFLGEKNRAAVAKLEDKTTLFLVPPSEFSEKVLKVPGKLSISGVILRFKESSSDLDSGPVQPKPSVDESTIPSSSGNREGIQFSSLPDPFVPPPPPRPYPSVQEIQRKEPLVEPVGERSTVTEPGLDRAKPPLLPEQLAQLASFLGQQKHLPRPGAVSLPGQVGFGRGPEMAGRVEPVAEPPARARVQEKEPEEPEKRLQATLQLAAALLQQIQHQSKPDS